MTELPGGNSSKAIADSLLAEFRQRIDRGEDIDREVFLQEHPEHADNLRELLETADRDGEIADPSQKFMPSPDQMAQTVTFVASPAELVPDIYDQETWNPGDTGGPAKESTDSSPPTPEAAANQPKRFGGYELLEEIARGGMGVVYKARQVKLDRIVAIKMILSGEFASHSDVARFYVEAKAAAALRHPNIVPVYDVGEQDGQHYLSMGYVDGESLADRIARGPVPPREASNLVQKMATAIAVAHDKAIIHRDLKPANVMLEKDGNPCITDFGLAKQINDDSNLTVTGLIFGTPSYMSPEQAAGNTEEVGPPSDIYSLGAVFYCLLTGKPPFQAKTPALTVVDVINRKPDSPRKLNPAVPQELEAICLKCLSKPIDERFSSARQLADALSNWQLSATNQNTIARKRIGIIGSVGILFAFVVVWIAFNRGERQRVNAPDPPGDSVPAGTPEPETRRTLRLDSATPLIPCSQGAIRSDDSSRALHVDSQTLASAWSLGETNATSYELDVLFEFSEPSADQSTAPKFGLIFGASLEDGKHRHWQMQMLELRPPQEARSATLRRIIATMLTDSKDELTVGDTPVGTQAVDYDTTAKTHHLSLKVGPLGLQDLQWDGTSIARLVSQPANSFIKRSLYKGQIGFFVEDAEVVLKQVHLRILD